MNPREFIAQKGYRDNPRRLMEDLIHLVFLILGLVAVGSVLVITIYLVISGLPAIFKIGPAEFLFGTRWASTASEPEFGILPFILTSIYGTAGAIVIGVPIGFFAAVFLAKMAPRKVREVMELLPGIRIIFGVPDGATLFAAIIVLAVMILPSVINVSLTALQAVPREYEEASLALGATSTETYFRVTVPAAKSGIFTAIVLGIGRAIGEAMAIMMVAGNVANMPSIFKSVRFLTTAVASEMSYSSGLQREALFSIALVLFLFIMIINAILNVLKTGGRKG